MIQSGRDTPTIVILVDVFSTFLSYNDFKIHLSQGYQKSVMFDKEMN